MDDFDFGDIDVAGGTRWYKDEFPTEGNMLLLLDADFIAYTVGFCSTPEEYQSYLEGKLDLLDKLDHACFLIRDAMTKAKADAVRLYLTDSKSNFRLNLTDSYKEQRTDEKPPFWQEVKDWMGTRKAARWSVRNEADDMISIDANAYYKELDADGVERNKDMYALWSKIIIGSKDKDIDQVYGNHVDLNTGKHYFVDYLGELKPKWKDKEINYYEYYPTVDATPVSPEDIERLSLTPDTYSRGARKGEVKTKRVCLGKQVVQRLDKLKGTGSKFFYAQVLMGDTVDNYFGLPNFGMVGTYELLDQADTIEQCHELTVAKYKEVLGDEWEDLFLLNARMAWMCQEQDEVWNPELMKEKYYD